MSEEKTPFFEASFNRAIKIRSRDDRLTSDAGVLLLREADHRLGLVESLGENLYDPRDPTKIRYRLTELLRERVYSLIQGYAVADDVDLLAQNIARRSGKLGNDRRFLPTQEVQETGFSRIGLTHYHDLKAVAQHAALLRLILKQ